MLLRYYTVSQKHPLHFRLYARLAELHAISNQIVSKNCAEI